MASLAGGREKAKTTTETKRVFLRAERGDTVEIAETKNKFCDGTLPESVKIIQRQYTYHGPKFRVEGSDEQYLLTSPGPDADGLLWKVDDMEWIRAAEVVVEFGDELPEYEICLHCGEPIKTTEHERESYLGTCDQ